MDPGRTGWSQMLSRMSNAARERAPVAAEFEDCSQRFDRLSSVMEANESTWEPYQILLNDYRNRLAIWGSDTGARSRTVDYVLRKSSRLQSQALDLLEHLHESLQNILDLVETTATPMLAPPTADLPPQSYFDARPLGDDASQSIHVLEKKIRPYIETVAEIFDRLVNLVPALQDPVPWDDYQGGEPGDDLQTELERAKRMFGKAPPALVERLGYANWKRSRYLQHLRERSISMAPKTIHSASGSGLKREAQFPTTIPLHTSNSNVAVARKPDIVDVDRRPVLSTTTSTTLSTGSTTFSKHKVSTQISSRPATSIAENEEFQKPKPEPVSESKRYFAPKPPTVLEPYKTFVCPYCLHEITVGAEKAPEKDWEDHVYMDLEPYMCTYELCSREQKTYGLKEDWFQHELNTHRILKIYSCQECELEYEDQALLEQHIWEVHDKSLQPQALAIIASMCERFSQKSAASQECHLCSETCRSMQLLRDHLADHLEQFALTSIKSVDELEDDSPPSPQFSDSGSEQRFRLGLAGLQELELMVEEKIEPVLQKSPISMQRSPNDTVGMPGIRVKPGSAMASVMRPTFGKRGNSYTLTSRATEHINQLSAMTAESKKSSQIGSMNVTADQASNAAPSSRTIRTGVAPRKVEFEGRIQDLKQLYTNLSVPGHTCFLNGTGGIGKSALAAEYTYRFETEYSYIFWVQAETPIVCADTYCEIAKKVVMKDEAASEDQEKLIMLSRDFLQNTTKRWLLIFDNVDEWLDLKHFLPSNFPETSGSILITTQRVDLIKMSRWPKISQMTLDGLSLDESRRLLLKYSQPGLDPMDIRSHAEFKLAGDIAKLAERLPLALSLISGYILVSGCSLTDFVELWNERRSNMQRMGAMPLSSTDAALETAWDLGLREVPVDAQDLLSILAFLDSDNIQREMLVDDDEEPVLEMLRPGEAGRFKRMKVQLSRRKLITVENRSGEEIWSIHRSLQAKILQELNHDPQKRERVYAQAFHLIRKRFPLPSPIQVPEPSKWSACRRYLPHVLSLRKIFTGHMLKISPSIKLAQLFSDGGIDLWERGMTNEGLDLLKSAEAILDQLECREDLLRANIHVIISLLIQDSGLAQLAECKARISLALDIRKKYHNATPPESYTKNDEILLYNAWSDYGCVLLQYNQFQEAQPIFAACFEKYKSWDPPEAIPYEYSKYYHHMAFCLMYQMKFAEAIELAEQGLHWVTVATGLSAAYNRWKFDLACIVLQSGDLNRALSLHQEILESRTEQHGSSAYLTLQSWYSVGAVQAYLGDLVNAEHSMRRFLSLATSRDDSCPGAAIARTRFHLSDILQQQDKCLTEAQELKETAMQTLHALTQSQSLEPLKDVKDEHRLALFDHLQPVFDGRFTGRHILEYVST